MTLADLISEHRLVNHEGLADDGPCIQMLPMENLIEQVLLQDHAKRLVNAALAHQELLMATFANRSKDLFSIVVNVDPVDIHAGSHDVADPAIADIEDPLHHFLLHLLQQPTFLTGSD
jgi:hypothetical protein